MKKRNHSASANARILTALDVIDRHLDGQREERLTTTRLAAEINWSSFHLQRLFRKSVGESVYQYVRRLQLDRASCQLLESDRAVTGIALDAGYATAAAFSAAFQLRFGVSPSVFRRAHVASSRMPVSQAPALARRQIVMRPDVVDVAPFAVVCVRRIGPSDELHGATAAEAWRVLRRLPMDGPPDARAFGAAQNQDGIASSGRRRYDACVALSTHPESCKGPWFDQRLGGGRFAVCRYRGRFDQLGQAWELARMRLRERPDWRARRVPGFEEYRCDPRQPLPEWIEALLYLPVV